ncbi:hypothetical protein JCM3765_000033 [Sporobolomyces pararoseus]
MNYPYRVCSSTALTKVKEEKKESDNSAPQSSLYSSYTNEDSWSTISGGNGSTGQTGYRAGVGNGEKKRKLDDLGTSTSGSTSSRGSPEDSMSKSKFTPPPEPLPAFNGFSSRYPPTMTPFPSYIDYGRTPIPFRSSQTSLEKDPVVDFTSYYNDKINRITSESVQLKLEIDSLRNEREQLRNDKESLQIQNSHLQQSLTTKDADKTKLLEDQAQSKKEIELLKEEVRYLRTVGLQNNLENNGLRHDLDIARTNRRVDKKLLEEEKRKRLAVEKELKELSMKVINFTDDVGIGEADGSKVNGQE